MTLLASLLLNISFPQGMPTFITEVLRLVSNVQLVKHLLLILLCQEFTTHFVTKAPPIDSINGMNNSRTHLTSYPGFISCNYTSTCKLTTYHWYKNLAKDTHTYVHAHTHARTHARTRTHTHAHTHTLTRTYTYKYMYALTV